MRQSELQHKVGIFVTNGKLEEAQEILSKIDYGPDQLGALAILLEIWYEYRRSVKTLARERKQASRDEAQARKASDAAAAQFRRIARRVFKGNEPVLTELGLYPPMWRRTGNGTTYGTAPEETNGTTESQTEAGQTNGGRRRRNPSRSTAAVIDRRRMMFGKALELSEEDQALLAKRGWSLERIQEAANLVEAHAQADILHTQKTQAHADASADASAAAAELEARYLEARGYTKDALAPLPEKKRARLERLLGL